MGTKKGFNRFFWDLERKGERHPSTPKPKSKDVSDPGGPNVLPGKYMVKIAYGEYADSTNIVVELDPRIEFNETSLKTVDANIEKAQVLVAKVTDIVDELNDIKKSISVVEQLLSEDEISRDIKERTKTAKDTIKYFIELINAPEDVQGIQRSPDILSARLSMVNYYIGSAIDRPNQSQELLLTQVSKEVEVVLDQINQWLDEDWKVTQGIIEEARLNPFKNEDEE